MCITENKLRRGQNGIVCNQSEVKGYLVPGFSFKEK